MGNVRTRFLGMPVANIDLDFNNAVAFMSDRVGVMKGARSGVQKRIKTEMPHLYDSLSCL